MSASPIPSDSAGSADVATTPMVFRTRSAVEVVARCDQQCQEDADGHSSRGGEQEEHADAAADLP